MLARPGMTEAKFAQILARQMPDAEKRKRAHFVVDTGGTIAASAAEIDRIMVALQGRIGSAYAQYWA